MREYQRANPDIYKRNNRKHYQKIKKKECARKKVYRETNKETINKYFRERRKRDPEFKLLQNLRRRTNFKLRNCKSASTQTLLGCSIPELKEHLESNFTKGMEWANYGTLWHIDHIKPCAAFDLLKEEEQLKCFHYTNLQPLLASENLKKGSKYDPRTTLPA